MGIGALCECHTVTTLLTSLYYKEELFIMHSRLITVEGIVLRTSQGREGGRSLSVFTKENGLMQLTVPRAVMQKCGTGALLSLAQIRFSAILFPEYGVIRQYEGRLLLDMMGMSYEEMQQWYYVIELMMHLFPENQSDYRAYQILEIAALTAQKRNKMIAAFIAVLQLLRQAGLDPAAEEPMEEGHLSETAKTLMTAFASYTWNAPLGVSISAKIFQECAYYVDHFILYHCDIQMNTKGAFVKSEELGVRS